MSRTNESLASLAVVLVVATISLPALVFAQEFIRPAAPERPSRIELDRPEVKRRPGEVGRRPGKGAGELPRSPEDFIRQGEPSSDFWEAYERERRQLSREDITAARQTASLDARTNRPASFAAFVQLPTTPDEYRAVFGKDAVVSEPVEAEIGRVRVALKGTKRLSISAATFGQALRKTKSFYVAIVGHNETGQFRFLDGSTEHIEQLARTCRLLLRVCIFVSCRSEEFITNDAVAIGVQRDLTFAEAIATVTRIEEVLARTSTANPKELRDQLLANDQQKSEQLDVTFMQSAKSHLVLALVIAAQPRERPTPTQDGQTEP